MKRTGTLVIAVIISILIISLSAIEFYYNYLKPETATSPTHYVGFPPPPMPQYSLGLSQWEFNVTQGATFQIVVTIASSLSQQVTFTPTIQLAGYGNGPWNASQDSAKVYNATFTQAQIVLEPYGNSTTILTINMAQDAQLGRYLFYVGHSSTDIGLGVGVEDALTVYVDQTEPIPMPKPIPSQSNFYLGDSRVFVISANASYGNYPFPTVTSGPGDSPLAKNGEPCVIINVTLRNDYSYQNPSSTIPNGATILNGTGYVNIALTANLFNNKTKISSRDITNAFPLDSVFVNRAFARLGYGETTEVTDYIATNSHDVTSFQLVPYFISEMPPP